MDGERVLKFKIVPEFGDVSELSEQMRRTGESLIHAAEALERLSEGSPDAARTVPDRPPWSSVCPFISTRTVHDAHVITVTSLRSGTVEAEDVSHECPGWPVRPWHRDSPTF